MQRGPGSHRPWAADWQCGCHVSFPRCQHSIQIYISCLFCSSPKHRAACRRQGQGRAGQAQGSTQQMQQMQQMQQASATSSYCTSWLRPPALSGGYMVRHFQILTGSLPVECQAQETGKCGARCVACSRKHIIYNGAKLRTQLLSHPGAWSLFVFLLLKFKRQINPSPTSSTDLLLPKMEVVVAPNHISHPGDRHDPNIQSHECPETVRKHVEKRLVDSASPDTRLLVSLNKTRLTPIPIKHRLGE